jgi:hypothetical protein
MRITSHHAIRAVLPLLLGAALLVGCGDDDSTADDTTTTEAVDAQAAIDQVNGICTRFEAEFDELAETETELLSLAASAIDLYDQAIDDFESVEASGETAETLGKMIDSLDQARTDMQNAVDSGDEDEVSAAGEEIDARNEELDAEVRDAGFTACNDEEPTDETETTLSGDASTLEHVDLTDLLTAPTGYGLQSVDPETVEVLGEAFSSEPALLDLADRYGTTTVYAGEEPEGLLIFVGLKEVPDEATRAALLQGIAGTGVDVETGTVAGSEGVKYTDSSGALTFATVRDDSVLMAISPTQEALEAIVAGLFEQNPDL